MIEHALLDAGPFYRHAPCGYVTTTLDGTVVAANPTFRTWVGAGGDVLGARLPDLLSPAGRVVWTTQHLPRLASTGEVRDADLDLATPGGRLPVLVGARLVERGASGEVEPVAGLAAASHEPFVLLTFFDATTRRGHELELRAARAAAQAAHRRSQVLQEVTGACATATTTSELVRAVVVAARAALEAVEVRVWLPGPDGQAEVDREGRVPGAATDAERALAAAARRAAAAGVPHLVEGDDAPGGILGRSLSLLAVPLPLGDGGPDAYGVLTAATHRELDDDLATYRALGVVVGQALERTRLHAALQHAALHDALTGAGNRALLDDAAQRALARAVRSRTPVTALLVDLDEFKAINDTWGHAAGDAVLRATANRLRAAVRPGDVVARLGGDEFAVLCEGLGEADAAGLQERVASALAEAVLTGCGVVPVRASVGVSTVVPETADRPAVEELLRGADRVMYALKRRAG